MILSRDDSVEFRSFGRRRGRKLRPKPAEVYQTLMPHLGIEAECFVDGFEPGQLFEYPERPLYLEIGFGGGEYLFARSQLQREVNFIGAEPFENGVSKLLGQLAELPEILHVKDNNIRIFVDDVRGLLRALPDECLARVDIMFPDPWPKARHFRRRLIQANLFTHVCRVLQPNAELYIATDDPAYLQDILILMQQQPSFRWQANSCADWQYAWGNIQTRYAQKAEQVGRKGYYLQYRFQSLKPAVKRASG